MFQGFFQEEFLESFLAVLIPRNIHAPEFEEGIDAINIVIQNEGIRRFCRGPTLDYGHVFAPAEWGVGAIFREMESSAGTVATIGCGFERAILCSVRLIDTDTAHCAEIAGGNHFHGRRWGGRWGHTKIRYRGGIQFFKRAGVHRNLL